ncbi:hypothetical protein DFH09DRAFT_1357807 [Mycena vulgaris]|nr:hypothetical protein DFH09DRAFT_1357807 [Mycena vulgaris]
MFRIPQPPNAETMEGCPLLELTDAEEDVFFFLRAIMDSLFFAPYPAPTTFDTVAGVLRLSAKYEVDYLRRRALAHSPLRLQAMATRSSWPDIDDSLVSAINLAHQTAALWILPHAFYALAAGDPDLTSLLCGPNLRLNDTDQLGFLQGYLH